ncbi:hypothetical protein TVAG_407930 [Trichomonas vaginalis G3]|uniref:Uncharacterized protein n=1 Tax=Trichomonas vaginalis (strain ATCC PRA-98 / G3) TaxID=412133 RepID=A2FNM4_TRIV3|nr:hypothetical protein TVAGG3_0386100 [Trichomonas vaginalis G3]EAX93492.1 hypothetical protein TVAG_407930 [Trichomonas vaginalis G3]KAI5533646.1 hypothetical protein TVAGG3_0386100 [Trichomonas vaginalis G3]|eukprot:XP_001306422.1 hypothetical protein [Trichomonas vaginalis G3]
MMFLRILSIKIQSKSNIFGIHLHSAIYSNKKFERIPITSIVESLTVYDCIFQDNVNLEGVGGAIIASTPVFCYNSLFQRCYAEAVAGITTTRNLNLEKSVFDSCRAPNTAGFKCDRGETVSLNECGFSSLETKENGILLLYWLKTFKFTNCNSSDIHVLSYDSIGLIFSDTSYFNWNKFYHIKSENIQPGVSIIESVNFVAENSIFNNFTAEHDTLNGVFQSSSSINKISVISSIFTNFQKHILTAEQPAEFLFIKCSFSVSKEDVIVYLSDGEFHFDEKGCSYNVNQNIPEITIKKLKIDIKKEENNKNEVVIINEDSQPNFVFYSVMFLIGLFVGVYLGVNIFVSHKFH